MVDPGAAQLIIKQLNRWYRRRSQPRGTIDHFYRGTRMTYNSTNRLVNCFMSLFIFTIACVGLLVPAFTEDKSWWFALFLKIGCSVMLVVSLIPMLQVFCEFVVVNDDGLLKSDFLGRKTQMAWNEILRFQVKPDDNKVILFGNGKFKLTMNLAYDGWQDFLEMAGRRLNPALYTTIAITLANVDAKKVNVPPLRKLWKKPFATRRMP